MTDTEKLTALCAANGAEITLNAPLAPLTTFKIGGPCDALITLQNLDSAKAVFAFLRENQIPHRLIGRGSNLLVPDEGYAGVVLKLGGQLANYLALDDDGCGIHCGAGVSLQKLCQFALENSLTGLEFAYGIPGSVGGAIFMDAGAYDGDISQVLANALVLQPDGLFHSIPAADMDFRYRHSIFMEHPEWIILNAYFTLKKGDPEAIRGRMQELIGRRKDKQPLEFPSAGSTFKRPAGSYASKLIDECGLKGYTVGGAQVSEKHAGFVINRGGATFADVMSVCAHVRETVQQQTGFVLDLEPEILRAESCT
ncbi:MAG TPA: UDP-N-acetylenolpyruvoylglucosamine reductase [Ruminococcus sp.]|nr:UDP-N-acetylenolpyruvoylglucosamine reductase [Ruminococcus sp.]